MTPLLIWMFPASITLNVTGERWKRHFTWSPPCYVSKARPPQQGDLRNRKCWSPLTWIVQVYSESSSSLTVQLHSLSRLLMLLLISRLSIFSIVCERDHREVHTAHTYKFMFWGVNGVPGLCSNTWSAAARVQTGGGGASFYLCVSADWAGCCVSPVNEKWEHCCNCCCCSSLVRLNCHPLTTPSPPVSAVAMPLSMVLGGLVDEWRICQPTEWELMLPSQS